MFGKSLGTKQTASCSATSTQTRSLGLRLEANDTVPRPHSALPRHVIAFCSSMCICCDNLSWANTNARAYGRLGVNLNLKVAVPESDAHHPLAIGTVRLLSCQNWSARTAPSPYLATLLDGTTNDDKQRS